ncbi:MAG: SsrA-binding protein [Flavobacteriaceae bacterium]|nr:SsrA-binding protein [Flavobacteriaceae bacterium]
MKHIYQILAKFNKILLPSYSKKGLNLSRATKFQLLIIGYRYFITKNSL